MILCQYHQVFIFAPLKNNDSSPGRAHNSPQTVATSRRSLLFQAHHTHPMVATILLPLPSLTEKFAPSCLHRYQMPDGSLQAEVGPKPKLNTRGCVTKEEEGNSPLQQHVQQANFL